MELFLVHAVNIFLLLFLMLLSPLMVLLLAQLIIAGGDENVGSNFPSSWNSVIKNIPFMITIFVVFYIHNQSLN